MSLLSSLSSSSSLSSPSCDRALRPHLLLCNDDGIHAPGLRYLWKCLSPHYKLTICAPMQEQSGMGMAITLREPLRMESLPWHLEGTSEDTMQMAWAVSGTPADCIKLALHTLFDAPPDLVLTGINRGSNAGRTVLYSGTVAGAIEGALQGIPSIAFSCTSYDKPDYAQAADYIPAIIAYALAEPFTPRTVLNVNFPELTSDKPKGFRLTRQGKEFWGEQVISREHPVEGHTYYWMGSRCVEFEEHAESDIALLQAGYITAVPLQVQDLTDHHFLEERKLSYMRHFSCFS